jgi:hypothetical protein
MSELIQNENRTAIRWRLLASASALALAAQIQSPDFAQAEDSDHPTVWIELGGQFNQRDINSQPLAPDFTAMRPSDFSPSVDFEKQSRLGFDEYGTLAIQPHGSDWVFSASVQYGRSSKDKHIRQQSNPGPQTYIGTLEFPSNTIQKYPRTVRFADTAVKNSEQHLIADFQAGKDVGLGLFGRNASSIVSVGVRFAQFTERSRISLKSDPDWHFQTQVRSNYGYHYQSILQPYHYNSAHLAASRSFGGLGPKVSWSASFPVTGNERGGELDFDWGVNAAVLFGRQKTRLQHDTTVRYNNGGAGPRYSLQLHEPPFGELATVYHNSSGPGTRSRSVVVPNIGGFAGISFKYDVAKLSLGYKGDFFFGAIDGGIDANESYSRNFFGPYASISIGFRNGP